jgi:23S rRNA (cytosine1962-C5)-methyltransferase
MERVKHILFPALLRILRDMGEEIEVIYERNEVAIRELEGLTCYQGFVSGDGLLTNTDGKVLIRENGIQYEVDYFNGQKTGFFLDQKYNRAAVARLARGKHVLDCFTHTGAFALNAAAAGAAHVTAVDVSQDAIHMARSNAVRNGLDGNMDFVCADVFDLLTDMAKQGHSPYDFIILDPPAFTKSRATIKNAIRGYKEINLKAMKLLPRGGYLATCSCSHFMSNTYFCQMMHNAAADAQVSLRQIEGRQQSPDHPILWNVPETDYLKFYLFQIV